jgi:hypothetical protein
LFPQAEMNLHGLHSIGRQHRKKRRQAGRRYPCLPLLTAPEWRRLSSGLLSRSMCRGGRRPELGCRLCHANEKRPYPRRQVESSDPAGHVEQVEADPRHDMEDEAPDEKRLRRDAKTHAREHLCR